MGSTPRRRTKVPAAPGAYAATLAGGNLTGTFAVNTSGYQLLKAGVGSVSGLSKPPPGALQSAGQGRAAMLVSWSNAVYHTFDHVQRAFCSSGTQPDYHYRDVVVATLTR
ncbi:hypothetical protein CCM_03090 [Cordyceps militaris CM01]|uniref:Uncharacterized protein n=1 Tax=Cordyceps militaris (strain CM01) TaxID=983644 RepID=G3J8T6_CORMM|nr:uncharacterized protein CCM_03090 [Cordyceps militaris CM01]EGX94819.1 hypothetical protein CCM_03090 [Cordyceps militaris CM01]